MSGASVSDVNDRLSALELRVQQQEDELTVMKAALADVLRRLAASEVSAAAAAKKQAGGKGECRHPLACCPLHKASSDWPVLSHCRRLLVLSAGAHCTHSSAAPCRWVTLLHRQWRDGWAEEREGVNLRHQEGNGGIGCQEVERHTHKHTLVSY